MTFSEHLLSLRISKGLKQQEIAEKLGISLRVYQYYEHGDTGQPLNFCGASGLLVMGAVGIPLRLTALGLIGVSCCAKKQMVLPL